MSIEKTELSTLLLSKKLDLSIQETEKIAVEFLRFALDKRYSKVTRNSSMPRVFGDFKFMSGVDLQVKV